MSVNYVDKKTEDPPAPPKPKFEGSGHRAGAAGGEAVGGGASDEALMIGTGGAAGSAQSALDSAASGAAASVRMAVRLATGKRLRLTMTPATTVRSMMEAVAAETPAGVAFRLYYGRPARAVAGDSLGLDVEAAGLKGEALTQQNV